MLPGMLVIFAVTLIVWTLAFLYFRNYLRRRTGSRRILAEFQEEVDKLIIEIDSATDRGLTLMEDRISSLKTLLDETDRRISVYKKETERRTIHEHAYAELGKKMLSKPNPHVPSLFVPEELSNEPSSDFIPEKKSVQSDDIVVSSSEELNNNNRQLSNEGPKFIRSSIRVEPKTPFAEQVLYLANAGFSKELIAHHLGTAIAEVELAIALTERKNLGE
jgi:hypothetical protein